VADTADVQLLDQPFQLRVGLDVAAIDDVARSVERFGDRYRHRLFTDHELACCSGSPSAEAAGLAARFAAKEATLKVLRPTDVTPQWKAIEVRRHAAGWCSIGLSGTAARLGEDSGVGEMSVSFSHEAGLAVAVVIAVCRARAGEDDH
jgi:holo-[acyl-carrier protein] synthase